MGSTAQNTTDITTPAPTGPWGVGRRLLEWVDSSRQDPTDSSRFRTLPIWVWYPTEKSGAVIPQHPLNDQWRTEQGKYLDTKVGPGASRFLQSLEVWSVPDAPIGAVKERFPVLIFGPGHTWLPTDYCTIVEDIVSHGYIVVGYVPTGCPGVTQLQSGKLVPATLTIHQQDITFDDALFVTKHISRLESSWLKDIIDTARVGIFGHSQGGVAATVVAAKDPTIKAFVNLDGDLMGTALLAKARQPALLLSNDERVAIAAATGKWDREGRERSEYRRHADWVRATDDAPVALRIRIEGTRHLNFNDLALVPLDQMTAEERKNKVGEVDGTQALKVISTLTRQFFDTYLKKADFFNMVKLEETYPGVESLLWKGLPTHS